MRNGLIVFLALLPSPLALALADKPPTPEEERAALRLADPALKIELVASEPAVVGPVAAAWDEAGRLYVAEMSDYPVSPDGGRIKRLEDRDGDGVYEHVTVFADGLHFPSGVLPWNGGVLVTAAPDLVFLKDADGDGKAEVRTVILTGFAEGNQQLRVNSPTWGRDNRVYLANGRSGGLIRRPTDPPGKAVAIPRNDLRVDPATGAFEPVAGFSQFGLPRDDRGDRFPSWNTVPIRHVVLENRAGQAADTPTVADVLDLADGGRIFSLAPTQKRFNAETVAYFNATCGPFIHRSDALGANYLGHAFVCEPLTSVVHHRRLDPDGPTYVARRVEPGREFLDSTHPWFRPVNLTNGPDGALYVVDFCRALVEHPAFVPEAQRNSVNFREGDDHGRIWRITRRDAKGPVSPCRFDKADVNGLVAGLAHPNGWCRDTAQRLIVERKEKGAVAPLRGLARSSPMPLARVHALWTLDGLDALDAETLRAGLHDADPSVREASARLCGDRPRAGQFDTDLAALTDDPDPRVRLRVAVAFNGSTTVGARDGLAALLSRDSGSPWMVAAVVDGTGVSARGLLTALDRRDPSWFANPTATQARTLVRLSSQMRRRLPAPQDQKDRAPEATGDAAAFALFLGMRRAIPDVVLGLRDRDRAAAAAESADRPAWLRALAIELLAAADAPRARPLLPSLLDPRQPPEVQEAAAHAASAVLDPTLASTLLDEWDRYALGVRRVVLGALVTRPELAERLVDAVERGSVAKAEVDPASAESLRRLNDPKLHAKVEALFTAKPDTDRKAVITKYEPALTLKAEPKRGQDLFAKNCQTCHARNGQGAKVGPDLVSVTGRPPADLLTAILDPSREAAPDGRGVVVLTTNGQTLTGLLAGETPEGVRLRRAGGLDDVIPRGEIEAVRPTGRSLMPDGLEQALSPQDMADLIAYLRTPTP